MDLIPDIGSHHLYSPPHGAGQGSGTEIGQTMVRGICLVKKAEEENTSYSGDGSLESLLSCGRGVA